MWWYMYRLYRTNQHLQVPITKGTVTDSCSEHTGFISGIGGYIYRTGELYTKSQGYSDESNMTHIVTSKKMRDYSVVQSDRYHKAQSNFHPINQNEFYSMSILFFYNSLRYRHLHTFYDCPYFFSML